MVVERAALLTSKPCIIGRRAATKTRRGIRAWMRISNQRVSRDHPFSVIVQSDEKYRKICVYR
jgi:hypothetical protein